MGKKNLKIGIDIRTCCGEKAGKGWYTFKMVENLLKLDHHNQYILYTQAGVPAFAEYENAEQKIFEKRGIFWHRKVKRDLIKQNVDVFFAPSSYIIPSLLPSKIRSVVTVHDLVALLFPKHHNKKAVIVEKMLLKRVVKKAAKICTVSNNTKADLENKFDVDDSKIETIYCGVNDFFKPLNNQELKIYKQKNKLPKNFFLAVNTIIPRKNYPKLIKAFALFQKYYPDYHLLIVGKKGWQYQKVFEEVEKNYLEKQVHFLDYVSQTGLLYLYNMAEALVYPSLYEGFGMQPLEAMKCGCPVIASNVSSIPEVVGNAAIMVDPKDHHGIAQAMKFLITNPQMREELREKGFKQIQKFSWKKSAEQLLKVVNEFKVEQMPLKI